MNFNSVAHPQTNGLVEVTNKSILEGLKRRVIGAKGSWVDELPNILWASGTIPKRGTEESPFSLAYGMEAVFPPEVVFPTPRTEAFDEATSSEGLQAC